MEKNIVKTARVATWDNVGKSTNTQKISDALKAVGLDFEVEKRPLFFGPNMKKIADKFATVRTDRDGYLGIVGKGYEICQNETAFAFAASVFWVAGEVLHRRKAVLAAQGEKLSVSNLVLWRLRNGYAFLVPPAQVILKWAKAADVVAKVPIPNTSKKFATAN